MKLSDGVTKLHQDAATGKILHNVSITLSDGDIPEVKITLVARQETILNS